LDFGLSVGGLGFGFWVLGFGFWVLGFGFWVLSFGFWVLGFGFWVLGFGFLCLGFRVYDEGGVHFMLARSAQRLRGARACAESWTLGYIL
jgi:hypothetical protein